MVIILSKKYKINVAFTYKKTPREKLIYGLFKFICMFD